MANWIGEEPSHAAGEPEKLTSEEHLLLDAVNAAHHQHPSDNSDDDDNDNESNTTASNDKRSTSTVQPTTGATRAPRGGPGAGGLSFGGKTKNVKKQGAAARLRRQRTKLMMMRNLAQNDKDQDDASSFFQQKLPGAWKEKLWDLVGAGGGNRQRRAAKRESIEREYRNKAKSGALDSMQKAKLSRELMHRPTRETLFNTGVLNRGGLLSIIEWNMEKRRATNTTTTMTMTMSEEDEDEQEQKQETKEDQQRRAHIDSVRCPGRPGYVPLPHLCTQIGCGESHTLAIVEGGSVFLWGCNGSGQLGFPADKHNIIHEPHLLVQLKGVMCMSAACGKDHSVVVTEGGGVYTWGAGQKGQLGTGIVLKEGSHNPLRVEHRRMWVSLQSTSRNGKDRPIVSCGNYHSGICSVRGDVWMWGDNKYGQVYGLRHEDDGITPELCLSPINAMFPAAKSDGPSMRKTSMLIKSKMMTTKILTGAGASAIDLEKRRTKKVDTIPLLTLVPGEVIIKLITGTRHTVVMTSHGALWGWGDDSYGQLGDGNHHKHHHHHHHHHHAHQKRRRTSITSMLVSRAKRFHIGGAANKNERRRKKKKKRHHHHHQQQQQQQQQQDDDDEVLGGGDVKAGKQGVLSMPVLFSNVAAGSTYTVAFSVAGEMWLWGELHGVRGGHEPGRNTPSNNSKQQSVQLISDLLPGQVLGGEIMCEGEHLVVNTKLGVFSIEGKETRRGGKKKKEKNKNKNKDSPNGKTSHSTSILVARRISILDGQDVHSLKLAPGPRMFAVLARQKEAGMQVLRLKDQEAQQGSLEIVHTAGEHLEFEVSLRTHPSVKATTRHGMIRRSNYLSLVRRSEENDQAVESVSSSEEKQERRASGREDEDEDKDDDDGSSKSGVEKTRVRSLDSGSSDRVRDDALIDSSSENAKPWAPWNDIEVEILGPSSEHVQIVSKLPDAEYRENGPPAPVSIDVMSERAGAHWLNVTFRGAHVLGSPFCFYTLVGPPVTCDIVGHGGSHGASGIMRIGVATLVDVTMYDQYGNRCVLGPSGTKGFVDRKRVKLLVDGVVHPAECGAPTHSNATLSLLFKMDPMTTQPSPSVALTISVTSTSFRRRSGLRTMSTDDAETFPFPGADSVLKHEVAGCLLLQTVRMIPLSDVRVELPKRAIVGGPVEIKMDTRVKKMNASALEGGEKFVVTVIGPKVRSGSGGSSSGTGTGTGSGGSGLHDLPLHVRDHGDGTYKCVVWPRLPGVHLVAVQHASYDVVEQGGVQKQVQILQQVPGSPFRFQAQLPEAGSARRRRIVGSHIDKLHSIFNRLDIDQDGTVPSSTLASEMKREGSVSRLLDGKSLMLMLGEGEITKETFVESLVGVLPPETEDSVAKEREEGDSRRWTRLKEDQEADAEADEDQELEKAALRIQAIQRGRQLRRANTSANDERVEKLGHGGVSGVEIKSRGGNDVGRVVGVLGEDGVLRKTMNENDEKQQRKRLLVASRQGIQMRIVARSSRPQSTTLQQHLALPPSRQRPSSAGPAGSTGLAGPAGLPSRSTSGRKAERKKIKRASNRRSPKRPTSPKMGGASPRRRVGGAWSALSLRKEVRQKLEVLQQGPYWKEIPGARRPNKKHVDILPGYGAKSARDLHIMLSKRPDQRAAGEKRNEGRSRGDGAKSPEESVIFLGSSLTQQTRPQTAPKLSSTSPTR